MCFLPQTSALLDLDFVFVGLPPGLKPWIAVGQALEIAVLSPVHA